MGRRSKYSPEGAGLTTAERDRMKELEREVRELKRAIVDLVQRGDQHPHPADLGHARERDQVRAPDLER